jgi:type IV pilus assembly protein PilY1
VTYNGVVAFTPILTTNDACNSKGQSRIYVADYAAGKSVLPPTYAAGYFTPPGSVDDWRFVKPNGTSGSVELIVGDTAGLPLKVPTNPLKNPPAY